MSTSTYTQGRKLPWARICPRFQLKGKKHTWNPRAQNHCKVITSSMYREAQFPVEETTPGFDKGSTPGSGQVAMDLQSYLLSSLKALLSHPPWF